jgi:hypothetical protein
MCCGENWATTKREERSLAALGMTNGAAARTVEKKKGVAVLRPYNFGVLVLRF